MRNHPLYDILENEGGGGNNPPEPKPARELRKGYVTCDHCGCTLTQAGEVFRMSEEARIQNKQKDIIADQKETILKLRAELEEAKKPTQRFEQPPSEKFSII